ncbi:MAG: hypothetical protein NTW16_02690 [Bacteroidetes bacterium]|nr:hypothetical protein [Bacteroidota bacterium]
MAEEINPKETCDVNQTFPRPFLLTVLCLISLVYFLLLTIFFTAGLFNAGWITSVMNQYVSGGNLTKTQTVLVFGSGFFLHGLAFAGVILIWNLRKIGYYFLGISCLIAASYQLINPLTAVTPTAIYIGLILVFGFFYRRLH